MFGTGVSFRNLSIILDLAFATANVDNTFCTSYGYLFKSYQRMLRSKEVEYTNRIQADESYGTLCFDHQATRKISGKYEGNTHRLAIVWHSNKEHNVIGMVEMSDKTAESQANALLNTCQNFGIERNQISGLSCDNENTNVGIHGGTCLLIEKSLEKPLLRLMCRHHIAELMIKNVYHCLFTTDTPNNIFFPILKKEWSSLREANFPITAFDPEEPEEGDEDEYSFTTNMNASACNEYANMKAAALNELRAHSRNRFVRDDYREVTRLALMFLGDEEPLCITKRNQVKFRTIINPSNARFMATIIQGIECYLFRRSLEWASPQLKLMKHNITRFSIFVSLVNIRYWNRISVLFDAPVNDLKLLQDLETYKMFDRPVAGAAIRAMERHLNYMGEECAPLSLFSDKVSEQEKNIMASKMLETLSEGTRPRRNNGNDIAYCESIGDENFNWKLIDIFNLVGDRSHFFFDIMNLPREFLRLDSNEWKTNNDYNKAKNIVQKALICVNDGSERVIANCKSKFNKQRCRNETSFRQNMLSLHFDSKRHKKSE